MRAVAAGAAHTYGSVNVLLVKKRLVMATVAEVGLLGRKPLWNLVCFFVRSRLGRYACMARSAAHFHSSMDCLLFLQLGVALEAVDLLAKCGQRHDRE